MKSSSVREAPAAWRETLDILKARMGISAPVRMMVSATVHVPTIVGWLRPVILFPVGVLTGLAPEYIKALLAHELAHIRRRDYLVCVLQGMAEAMLFYHPAVCWVSSQIRTEREMCSDDVAVALGGDALAYVRALAGLESNRARQVAPLLAVNGGSLSNRIARVLGQSRTAAFNLPGVGVVVCGAILTVTACGLLAGAADTRPAFEVASVKPDESETGVDRIDFSKGSVIIVNVSLKRLIGMAYGVAEGRDYLYSGPQWLDSDSISQRSSRPRPRRRKSSSCSSGCWRNGSR
jgi:beta-lactamase regulating signal transducer with metallopeptidase domain